MKKLFSISTSTLKSLVDAIPNVVFIKDTESRFLIMNKAGEEQWGMRHDDLYGTDASQYFPVEQMQHFLATDRLVFERGHPINLEETVWNVELQQHRICHTFKNPIFDASGKPLYLICTMIDITDQKKVEDELRESNARYVRAVNAVNDGIWEWNVVTGEGYQLARWKDLLGYKAHELPNVASNFFDNVHPEDQPQVRESLHAHFEERLPFRINLRLRCKNGEYRWFLARGQAVWDDDGKPLIMTCAICDITERKLAEQALRDNDEVLKRIVATSLDGYWRVDMQGWLIDVNLAYCRQSGYTREELLGLHISALETTEDADTTAEHMQKVMTIGHDLFHTTHRHKDGSIWYAEMSTTFDNIAGGQFFVFIRNITERVLERSTHERRAAHISDRLGISEAVLRESEQRLALAAEAANLGVWIHDLVRNEIWASDQWRAIFGFTSSEEIDAASVLQRVHSEDRTLYTQRMELELQGRADYEAAFRIVLPDGKLRWIASRGRAEFGASGQPILIRGVSLDITTRKQTELEVEQQRLKITYLSRIATLGELSGAMAHELNQPLATILINAQVAQRLLAQESVDLNEISEVLQEIIDEDKRAGEVIWQLRQLFGKGETVRQSVDLNQLLLEVSLLLRNELIGRGVMLRMELASDFAVVNVSRVELQQVIINLVMNACDAMGALAAPDRLVVMRTAILRDESVQVSIIDRGAGLATGDLAQVFEPFYTTKEQGMGLGLSICRNIVSTNGGQLWCENNAECGASFHFSMPLQTTEVV